MNTKFGFRLFSAVALFSLSIYFMSCQEDDELGVGDSQNVSSEAAVDSYFEDVEDLSSTALMAQDPTSLGGRVAENDNRFCASTSVTFVGTNAEGTITIDFGTAEGCTDLRGNVRKGKIIITFTGNRFQINNSVTTTFENFSVNGVKIEGVRTVKLTSIEPIIHEITVEDGKITWPDNSFATRDLAHHFRKWDIKGTILDRTDDEVTLLEGGTASGINRRGKEYSMEITSDIVFKAQCFATNKFLPVAGEKIISVDGKQIIVNYGQGDCDNVISVTINGVTRVVTVERG
jgi:hypothetical protein